MRDFNTIQAIASKAAGSIGNELTFTYPEVLEVVSLCTENSIAVLGVEVLQVRSEGYSTESYSIYDQFMERGSELSSSCWAEYVRRNNCYAEDFIRLHPAGDDHVYVLTTASWREILETCTVP